MTLRSTLAAAVLLTAASATPLSAHHGWSGYDASATLNLSGQLMRVSYQNPHVLIDLKTPDKTWHVVLAPPYRMEARGLPNGGLKEGGTVAVVGYAHKTQSDELRAERITVAGKTVELR